MKNIEIIESKKLIEYKVALDFMQERINLINKRSKFNYYGFHISNPILKIFRNKILKSLVNNKRFINSIYYILSTILVFFYITI